MRYLLLIYAFLITHLAIAQDATQISRYSFAISYFGEKIFHPGLKLAANYSIPVTNEFFSKDRLSAGISLAGYTHTRNHVGLRITTTATFFHVTRKGFEYGVGADIGYMRRTYQGKVFKVDSNGMVQQEPFAGQHALTYGLYIELGKTVKLRNGKVIRIFVQPGLFRETNYNDGGLTHPVVSVGGSQYFNKKDEKN